MFDAIRRVVAEEGVKNCWNGATPTIFRAMSMNVSQLVTYEECKERLGKRNKDWTRN